SATEIPLSATEIALSGTEISVSASDFLQFASHILRSGIKFHRPLIARRYSPMNFHIPVTVFHSRRVIFWTIVHDSGRSSTILDNRPQIQMCRLARSARQTPSARE